MRAVMDYRERREFPPQAVIDGLHGMLKQQTAARPLQDWRDVLDDALLAAGFAVEWQGEEIFEILVRPAPPPDRFAPDRRAERSRSRVDVAMKKPSARSHRSTTAPAPAPAPFEYGTYSSPPCFMHELDPSWVGTQTDTEPPQQPIHLGEALPDWPEVRRWRKQMRSHLIARRMNISAEERRIWSARISDQLEATLATAKGKLVGFYWPFRGEYDARPLLLSLQDRDVRLALPVVVEKGQPLVFRAWSSGTAMTRGIWNIPIPADGEPVLPDVLIAPLVGFDQGGYRLGYGGGFYDRTIAAMPKKPLCVGVGFALADLETIHPQAHDIPMDLIHTER